MRWLPASLAALAAGLVLAAPVAAAPPTYADVAHVFNSKCTGCHTEGGIAPFSLRSATQAKSHAQLIKIMTQANAMPPWPPARDSMAFVGQSARQLTAQEKDLIARWVAGGAKLGPHVTLPPKKTVKGGIKYV